MIAITTAVTTVPFPIPRSAAKSCFSTNACPASAATADSLSLAPRSPERSAERQVEFHNTGLYNLPGLLSYPAPNVGIYEYTKDPSDVGKFKAPTLRNIALTAPYMHDGSIATLEGVLDHYAAGGRAHDNPNKDPLIGGFKLSEQDRQDLIEFLKSLTDDAVLHDQRFANPWQ